MGSNPTPSARGAVAALGSIARRGRGTVERPRGRLGRARTFSEARLGLDNERGTALELGDEAARCDVAMAPVDPVGQQVVFRRQDFELEASAVRQSEGRLEKHQAPGRLDAIDPATERLARQHEMIFRRRVAVLVAEAERE